MKVKNHKGHSGHIIPQPSDGLLTFRLAQAMQGENKQSVSSNLVLLSIFDWQLSCKATRDTFVLGSTGCLNLGP